MVSPTVPGWVPSPVDNRPGSATRPRWQLLLDDPSPGRVVVVGDPAPEVGAWLDEVGSDVHLVRAAAGDVAPADLVVVSDAAAAGATGREGLRWLATAVAPGGAVWIPGPGGRRLPRALSDNGLTPFPWAPDGGRHLGDRHRRGLVGRRSPGPPAWLVRLGGRAGWPVEEGRWRLDTPIAYPSQKAVARLDDGDGRSRVIVKVTQEARFSPRLTTEAETLAALEVAVPQLARARTPRVLAVERLGGLVAVAEEALEGRPFLEASSLRPGCPLVGDAVAALTELAVHTRRAVPGERVASHLATIVERFVARHGPPPAVANTLLADVDAVAAVPALPTVLGHGDAGTWNLMVVDGTVRVLDWESASPGAPPLWDLFHLIRSYAVRAGRRRGLRRDRAIDRHLITGSSLTPILGGWIRHQAEAVGVDRPLVGPLFRLQLAHRAVKEATRLEADRTGHYGPLCTRVVTAGCATGLGVLLEAGAHRPG